MHDTSSRRYLAFAALGAVAALRLARLGIATMLLLKLFGPMAALAGLGAVALFGLNWLVRIGALVGAVLLWHWPVLVALAFAAPRLFTMLPGALATLLARARHPRTLWQPPTVARCAQRAGP